MCAVVFSNLLAKRNKAYGSIKPVLAQHVVTGFLLLGRWITFPAALEQGSEEEGRGREEKEREREIEREKETKKERGKD